MVDVSTAVELDRLLERDYRGDIPLLLSFLQLVNAHIEVGDISLVVLAVVGLETIHNLETCF